MFAYNFILLTVRSIVLATAEWVSSLPSTLPKADYMMAIAYYNRTIFLIGGSNDKLPQSIIKYDIENDLLIDYDANALSRNTWGRSYYSQIDNILYMIDSESGNNLNTYNVQTNVFTVNALVDAIPTNVDSTACLTSIHKELYVMGGKGSLATVQIFTISSNSWRYGPSMLQSQYFTCKASSVTNKLYAIGGYTNSYLKTVEFISVENIDANAWKYTIDELTQGLETVSSAVYEAFIYVISGLDSKWNDIPIVHVIDTKTNTVSLLADEMVYGAGNMSPIVIGNRLYVFGGWNSIDEFYDTWQYYDLPALDLTTNPATTSTNEASVYPSTLATTSTNEASVYASKLATTSTNTNEASVYPSKLSTYLGITQTQSTVFDTHPINETKTRQTTNSTTKHGADIIITVLGVFGAIACIAIISVIFICVIIFFVKKYKATVKQEKQEQQIQQNMIHDVTSQHTHPSQHDGVTSGANVTSQDTEDTVVIIIKKVDLAEDQSSQKGDRDSVEMGDDSSSNDSMYEPVIAQCKTPETQLDVKRNKLNQRTATGTDCAQFKEGKIFEGDENVKFN